MIYRKGLTQKERIEESKKYSEELVQLVKDKWKDHYDFSNITYTPGNGKKIKIYGIKCLHDGNIFYQTIETLLDGVVGCKICAKRIRDKEILDSLYDKFGRERYQFSISSNEESGLKAKNRIIIKIYCKKHNTTHFCDYFELLEVGITGCPECRLDKQYEDFLTDLHKMYGDLYTVTRENFGGKRRREAIVHCNKHNVDFKCLANTLLSGEKICPKCNKKDIFRQDPITNEELISIKNLAKQGYPATKISIELKRDISTIRKILNNNSVSISNLFIPKLNELIKLLEIDHMSQNQAAKLLGMKRSDVYNAVRAHNIKVYQAPEPEWKSYNKEWWENKIINEGVCLSKLCEDLGTTRSILYRYLKTKLDVKVEELVEKRRELNIDRIKDLAKLGLSSQNISLKINIPQATIKRYCRDNNISLIIPKSNGEILVENYLISNNLKFKRNVTIHGIAGRCSDYVNIDFVLENNIWIEYDGSQHFKKYSKFHNSRDDEFPRQVQRDINVVEYCKLNKILLIRIPYTINTCSKVENLLDKVLKEGKDPKDLIDIESLYERPVEEILKELDNNEMYM